MRRLNIAIRSLPDQRIREINEDVNTHFTEGRAGGKSDEEIAAALGSPEAMAAEYCAMYAADQKPQKQKRGPAEQFFIALAILFFTLIIPFPIWVTLVCLWLVPASGIFISISGVISALAAIIAMIAPGWFANWSIAPYPAVVLLTGIALFALGALMCIGAIYYGKFLIFITRKYALWMKNAITGGN